ncbi:MAG: hypothetical protein COA99_07570 [Moraxellaceae bacterium]|nr:MAG: hypothetical protein COA99_07570 [Moraxellaceae bacterium]
MDTTRLIIHPKHYGLFVGIILANNLSWIYFSPLILTEAVTIIVFFGLFRELPHQNSFFSQNSPKHAKWHAPLCLLLSMQYRLISTEYM